MRRVLLVVGIVMLLTSVAAAEEKLELKDMKAKASYVIGYDMAANLKKQSIEIDSDIFMKAFNDAMAGRESQMSSEDRTATMMELQKEVRARHEEEMKKVGEENKKKASEFFAENKLKEGVVTLPSGLQYKVLTEGKGKTPTIDDMVVVNYTGKLLDGSEFDSSAKRGQPATFRVSGVIKGWTEALQLMKEGSKYELYIPADLAYGDKGAGRVIGPNAALIFDVELVSIKEGNEDPHAGHGDHP